MKVTKRHIEEEYNEGHPDRGGDGYWIHLKAGWKNADDPVGALHIIHEDTRKEARACHVMRCQCEECTKILST